MLNIVYFACTNPLFNKEIGIHTKREIQTKSSKNLFYTIEKNDNYIKEDPYVIICDMSKKYNYEEILDIIKQKNVMMFSVIKFFENENDKYMWLQKTIDYDSLDIFLILLGNNTFSMTYLESILEILLNNRKYMYAKFLLSHIRKKNNLVKLFKNTDLIFELAYKGLIFFKLIETEILNSDININAIDSKGDSLLIWASKTNKTKFIKYLIKICKIDKEIKDSLGKKAEYYVCLFKNRHALQFLNSNTLIINEEFPKYSQKTMTNNDLYNNFRHRINSCVNIEENFSTDDETLEY